MQACLKRLKKEAANALTEKDEFINLTSNPENIKEWKAEILGPSESPYENFVFVIFIKVSDGYPMLPPTIVFETKIFHPNVHFDTGEICLDILKREWTPAWTLMSACRAIVALLADPAPDSPLNCDAGNMLRADDHAAFRSTARLYCCEFATRR